MDNDVIYSQFLDGINDEMGGQRATVQHCPLCKKTLSCKFLYYDDKRLQFLSGLINQLIELHGYSDKRVCKYQALYDTVYEHRRAMEQYIPKKKHAGHTLGAREFTLTYSKKWFDDDEARRLMKQAVSRLLKYYADEICEFQVVGEKGEKGQSHIHGFYLLKGGKKITDKNFKRAWTYWDPKKPLGKTGFQGGHHADVKSVSDFKGYIDKEKNPWYLYIHNAGVQDDGYSSEASSSSCGSERSSLRGF